MELSILERKAMDEKYSKYMATTGTLYTNKPDKMFEAGYKAHMLVVEEKEGAETDKMLRETYTDQGLEDLKDAMDGMFKVIDDMKRS
jgi:hypothetical protein